MVPDQARAGLLLCDQKLEKSTASTVSFGAGNRLALEEQLAVV
jgi:hypothetical protein